MTNLDSILKSRDITADKGPSCQSYGFFSGYIRMWELDHKEGWALKNWCFRTVVLEKTLESPLDDREIKPVSPNRNQSWLFIGKDSCWSFNTLSIWCEEPTHWERLRAGEEGVRGWDGCLASLIQLAWVWANFRRSWRTGKPGVLQSMEWQRVGHDGHWTAVTAVLCLVVCNALFDRKDYFRRLSLNRLLIFQFIMYM